MKNTKEGRHRVRSVVLVLAGLAIACSASAARAQTDDVAEQPTLRIKDPFAAVLWRTDVDRAENYVVSSSHYKAVTVWPVADPESRRILRVPIRGEERQRAHGVAISPDGEVIAYSVPPLADDRGLPVVGTSVIYILRRADSAILHHITDVPTRPQALRFSPDGSYLAAALSDGCGLRVWSVEGWSLFGSDDKGYGGEGPEAGRCCTAAEADECDQLPDTPGLLFNDDDASAVWLITAGDTGLRTYGKTPDGLTFLRHATPRDIELDRPEGVALSPDRRSLAVGDRRLRGGKTRIRLRVAILELSTLAPNRRPLEVPEAALLSGAFFDPVQVPAADQMSLNRVAWSARNGEQWIFAGGTFWCQLVEPNLVIGAFTPLDVCLLRWRLDGSDAGGEEIAFVSVGTDRIMDLTFLPRRQAVLYATQKRIGALELDGEPYVSDDGSEFSSRRRAVDLRDRGGDVAGTWMAFRISDDAKVVEFEDYRTAAQASIRFRIDLGELRLETTSDRAPGLRAPNQDPNLVKDWRNVSGRSPEIVGERLTDPRLLKNDIYRSVALLPKKRLLLLGSANFIRIIRYSSTGPPSILCERRIAAEAYRVNVSADGDIAVVGHSDGTLRWYRLGLAPDTCALEPIVSFYVTETALSEWAWIAWLPSGHYGNDARARDLLGWQTVDAQGRVALVPFRRLLDYYDSDAVRGAIDAARRADAGGPAGRKGLMPDRMRLEEEIRPQILRVTSPRPGFGATESRLRFQLQLAGEAGPSRALTVRTNSGVRMRIWAGGHLIEAERPLRVPASGSVELDVEIPEQARRANTVFQACFHLDGEFQTCHPVDWVGPTVKPAGRRLWAVIVGVSDYVEPGLKLNFAQNDALDLARIFIDDHRRRQDPNSRVPPDFDHVHIDLIVAPTTPAAKAEVARLGRLRYVHLHRPTPGGILSALDGINARDPNEELSNDLFLFYFSGHGLIHPYNTRRGRSAFLTPRIAADAGPVAFARSSLSSDVLLQTLKEISAQKVVVFDACRTPSALPGTRPFDPGLVRREFEENVLSAHFFFSGKAAQFSLEQSVFAFDKSRAPADRGNGLFTYAMLDALTNPEADLPDDGSSVRNKIEIDEVRRFVTAFFNLKKPTSPVNRLRKATRITTIQQPVYVPARTQHESQVIRSLD